MYYPSIYNQWAGHNYTTLSQWRSISGSDTNSILGDPSFKNSSANNYSLNSNSKAIDKGDNLPSSYDTIDINGVARPQGLSFDIGVYEFNDGNNSVLPEPATPEPPKNLRVVN